MSYAAFYLVTPRQYEPRHAARAVLEAQTRPQGRPASWIRRAWRYVVDRPLV